MTYGKIVGSMTHVPPPQEPKSHKTRKRLAVGFRHKSSKRELVRIVEQHRKRTHA